MFHLINLKQIDGSEDDIKEVNAHAESRELRYSERSLKVLFSVFLHSLFKYIVDTLEELFRVKKVATPNNGQAKTK